MRGSEGPVSFAGVDVFEEKDGLRLFFRFGAEAALAVFHGLWLRRVTGAFGIGEQGDRE